MPKRKKSAGVEVKTIEAAEPSVTSGPVRVCPRCGRAAHHDQRTTYKNGNQLWACVGCGRLFVGFCHEPAR
jgi:ribosomal protein L37AE/L43A